MGRSLNGPVASMRDIDIVVPIEKGGTGGMSTEEAVDLLGGIHKSQLGVPNGVAQLGIDGKIDKKHLPRSVITDPTLSGSRRLAAGQTGTYRITNYDPNITYTVSVSAGSVSITGDTIFYTALQDIGDVDLIVNGRKLAIKVSVSYPVKPALAVSANTVGTSATAVLTTSNYKAATGVAGHLATDWEISIDPGFKNPAYNSLNDSANKQVLLVENLPVNKEYYVRARHHDINGNVSDWSNTVKLKTSSSSVISKEVAKLTAPDKANGDAFSFHADISSDGNRIVVGSYTADAGATDTGAAYVFVRNGDNWDFEAKLLAADKAAGDYFGSPITIDNDGTRIAVSAYGRDEGAIDTGAVYIFVRTGSTWTQEAKLTTSDKVAGDNFGHRLSIDADCTRLVSSAHLADAGAVDTGAVYIFTRNGTVWTQEAKLVASDRLASDYLLGVSITQDGSRVFLGASGADVGTVDTGAVYVFTRTGLIWTQEAKLVASDRTTTDLFGHYTAVDANGTRVAIAAPGKDYGAPNTGAVYIFVRSGTSWTQEAMLVASDRLSTDYFANQHGIDITDDGSRVIIGAYLADAGAVDSGAAYIFVRNGSNWVQEAKLVASDRAANDWFGSTVRITGDGSKAIVGSIYADPAGFTNAGALYVFST